MKDSTLNFFFTHSQNHLTDYSEGSGADTEYDAYYDEDDDYDYIEGSGNDDEDSDVREKQPDHHVTGGATRLDQEYEHVAPKVRQDHYGLNKKTW